jgi:hypothetical protein
MKHEAIHELYPNVKQVVTEADGTIKALDIDGNEVTITDWDAVDTKATELQTAQDDTVAQEATDKANAKAKLIAGEALTEAEADTIVI